MKTVILAGGYGTRISEESQFKPKPMLEIGGMPILWHIMKEYSAYGFNDFVICAGYKQHIIKKWFADYFLYTSDVTFDFTSGDRKMIVHDRRCEPWKVAIVDTGLNTMTGGRVKKVKKYIVDEPFMLTYGDGVSDINIKELVNFHKTHGKLVTISAYNSMQRFGVINVDDNNSVKQFREKSDSDKSMINIGFMVCQPKFLDYIDGDETVLEKDALAKVAMANQLVAYRHFGFWQCMDTLREKQQLEKLWDSGSAPWKIWKDNG